MNCYWVDRCKTYHSVETQHNASHLTMDPDFDPHKPRIHVSILDQSNGEASIEWDVQGCQSFRKDLGRWMRLRPNETIPS